MMFLVDALTPNEPKIFLDIDDRTGALKDDTPRNMAKIQLIFIGSAVACAKAMSCSSPAYRHYRHATVARGLPQ
jgi:hypothetical protein